MADGYVVTLSDEPNGIPRAYWDGSSTTEEIAEAAFYPSRSDAKLAIAGIISIYSDQEVEARQASSTIALVR